MTKPDIKWHEILTNRMNFHLERGEWDVALEVFNRARKEQAGEVNLSLKSSICELVSTRTANKLVESGYHTIEDICYATDEELLRIKGFGSFSVTECRSAIAELGLKY